VRHVERHAALTGVRVEEEQAAIGVRRIAPERRDVAGRVAAGRLDLDDVGTHVGEQLAAVHAAVVGKFEHAAARERHGGHSLSRITRGRGPG